MNTYKFRHKSAIFKEYVKTKEHNPTRHRKYSPPRLLYINIKILKFWDA